MFSIADGREHFFQWDSDRQIVVNDPTIAQVHFCNKTDTCSLVTDVEEIVIVADNTETVLRTANVPNILLQTDFPITVYAYCRDGYTKIEKTFKVVSRTRPSDYVYTETEVRRFSDLEDRVEAIEQNGVPEGRLEEAVEREINSFSEVMQAYSDNAANKAKEEAIEQASQYATDKANTAETNANTYTDNKASELSAEMQELEDKTIEAHNKAVEVNTLANNALNIANNAFEFMQAEEARAKEAEKQIEATRIGRMETIDGEALDANPDRPFSHELYATLINRERVYVEEQENKGVSTQYYLSANADKLFSPWGYNSLDELLEVWYWLDKSQLEKDRDYKEVTDDGKTTYHPRLYSIVARTLDNQVRVNKVPKSSDDATSKNYVDGGLNTKININSISATRDTDCVLIRAKNGGKYSGIPVGTWSLGNNSIPRFTSDEELVAYTTNTSSDGSAIEDEDGKVIGYKNGALVNKGYAKMLDNAVLENAKTYAYGQKTEAIKYTDAEITKVKQYADIRKQEAVAEAEMWASNEDDEVKAYAEKLAETAETNATKYADSKLALKINTNAISASSTNDCVLFRVANGGKYDGIPIGIHSLGGNSIPRFSNSGELNGATTDSSPSTALVNKSYADTLDKKVLASSKTYTDEQVKVVADKVTVLNGNGDGSVKKTVNDAIAKVVSNAPEDFDTLKEMSDWIASHEDDATAMNSAIQDNTAAISSLLDLTAQLELNDTWYENRLENLEHKEEWVNCYVDGVNNKEVRLVKLQGYGVYEYFYYIYSNDYTYALTGSGLIYCSEEASTYITHDRYMPKYTDSILSVYEGVDNVSGGEPSALAYILINNENYSFYNITLKMRKIREV